VDDRMWPDRDSCQPRILLAGPPRQPSGTDSPTCASCSHFLRANGAQGKQAKHDRAQGCRAPAMAVHGTRGPRNALTQVE
jgi:hypothetical protein